MAADRLFACVVAEITGLHAFFMHWLAENSGPAPDFGRCDLSLAKNFTQIAPDGSLHDRASVTGRLKAAKGAYEPGFLIRIEAIVPLWQNRNRLVATYIEEQIREGKLTRRRSTALFVKQASAPCDVAWCHLHETWMQVADPVPVQATRPRSDT